MGIAKAGTLRGDRFAATCWTEGMVNATGAAYRIPLVRLRQIQDSRVTHAQFITDHPKMLKALESF